MKVKIDQIIATLDQSEKVYESLLPVIFRERKAALGSNLRKMADASLEKETLLAQLSALEKQRLRLVNQLAVHMDIPAAGLNLSAIAEIADGDQGRQIRRLRESFGKLVRTVKLENEQNRVLIQHCLTLTQGAIGFFQHWMIPASVYGASGRISSGQNNGNLLTGNV